MSEKTEKYALYCKYWEETKVDENLAFFESHNSIDFAGNMLYIAKELIENSIYENIQLTISCTSDTEEKIRGLLEKYRIHRRHLVIRESEEYFYALATAKYLFTDVAYYSLFRKKRGQVCVSTWHGTPLKTLGFTFYEDSYVVANQKRGFLLADYFVCPNEYTWNCVRTSYQLDGLFKGEVIYGGYPRNSVFFDESRRAEVREELNIDNKKVVVYMPTWRGRVIQVNDKGQSVELQELLEEIDELLPDDYVMWTKLHRLNQNELDFSEFRHIKTFPSGYETYDVLNAADMLVTDYSSVMFDFVSKGRKIVLFCYDKEDYTKNRGCYFNIDELPFPIVTEPKGLVEEICRGKCYDDRETIKKFCGKDSIDSTVKIVRHIITGKDKCETIPYERKRAKKALLFAGDLNENNATDSLFEYLSENEDKNYYISYLNHLFKDKGYKLLQFGKRNQIPLYMYQGRYSNYTTEESMVMERIRKCLAQKKAVSDQDWRIQESIATREYSRYTYENRFSSYIRFAGLDLESLKWFRVFKGRKIIFIHDNMAAKAESNYEYRIYLQRALEVADEIHFANKAVFESMEKIMQVSGAKKYIEELY